MSRTADHAKREKARQLEAAGLSRGQIAAQLQVSTRTVSRWLGPLPAGRPRAAGDASVRTERRRRTGR